MSNEQALWVLRMVRRNRLNGHIPRKKGETDETYNARRADLLQTEYQALTRELMILDDLTYIIECVALTYTGEAKSGIDALRAKMEEIENPAKANGYAEALLKLDEAKSSLYAHDIRRAAGILSSISRSLWKRILPPC